MAIGEMGYTGGNDGGFSVQDRWRFRVSGVRCQEKETYKLKPETHDFVSASSFGALLNHHNGNSSVLGPAGRKAVVPYWFDLAAGKSIHAS